MNYLDKENLASGTLSTPNANLNTTYAPGAGAGTGFLNFGQAQGKSSADLLRGFGIMDYDDMDLAMTQTFDQQYGWKVDHMRDNMLSGVGQALGQTGTALQQMMEQSTSLASQSGLRRGRGAGLQQENIYNQFTEGLAGLQQGRRQGVEGLERQWYDDLTSLMGRMTREKEM